MDNDIITDNIVREDKKIMTDNMTDNMVDNMAANITDHITDHGITVEQIKKSAVLLKEARSAYSELIDFYAELFIAQEKSKSGLELEPIIIEPESLRIKLDSGMPLIESSQFLIDPGKADILLEKICLIAKEKAPKLERAAGIILASLLKRSTEKKSSEKMEWCSENLFTALIQNDLQVLKSIADAVELKEEELIFFGFAAISPAIQSCAVQLSGYIAPDSPKTHGCCPICGNLPQGAFLNQEGQRHLICGFCQHSWKVSRMGCTLCLNREKGKQHYFYNEEEKEYRVDLCDNCGKYLKTIDLRELTRSFYPRLELLCTLHLDMQASEKGYEGVAQK